MLVIGFIIIAGLVSIILFNRSKTLLRFRNLHESRLSALVEKRPNLPGYKAAYQHLRLT